MNQEISEKINTFFQCDFDWVNMQERYEKREKRHQIRRELIKTIKDAENIFNELFDKPMNIWPHISEDSEEELFEAECMEAMKFLSQFMQSIEKH